MRVEMPDGTIIDAPENASKQQVQALYEKQKAKPVASVPNELSALEKIKGASRSGLEGMTLGFADEIGLGIAALPASLATGDNYTDVYSDMRKNYNQEQGEFERQNPKTALGMNIAGGLLTGGTGASKVLATNIARANPIKAASLLGGATGATAGAGFAPTMQDVPVYTSTGAVFGAALPPLLAMGGKAASPMVSALKDLFTIKNPRTTAAKILGNFASKDGIPANQLLQKMQAMGRNATLSDVAGENLKGAARAVGNLQGQGKDAAKKMFEDRQSGSTKRLMGSLKRLSGGDHKYFNNMKKIVEKNRTDASQYYKEAEGQSIQVTDDLAELFSRPSVKTAIVKGSRKAADEGMVIPKQINSGDAIDFRTFDYAKRALDDKIGAAIRAGNKDDARILNQLKTQILEIADDQIPAYKTARAIYSEGAGNINAMELGRRVLKDDFDEMADIVGAMSKSEKEGFINGALKTVRDKLMTGREDKNAATKLATQMVRERLRTVFPDDDSYKVFVNQLDIEDDFARTYQNVFGGSQTQPRQVNQKELIAAAKGGDMVEGQDSVSMIVNAVKKVTGKDNIPQPVVDELQRIMFTPASQLTKKDWALLRKHNISGKHVKEIQGILPSALGLSTVEAGAGKVSR